MKHLAHRLGNAGWILRSGGAQGADSAFEDGAKDFESKILRPKHATTEAKTIAAEVHPAWHMCDDYARNLHGRNVQIILGEQLDTPVECVICWTYPNVKRGGTLLGINLAHTPNIPVFNLAVHGVEEIPPYLPV